LFSDESVIYRLTHKTTKVRSFYGARYPDIRLGKNYDWKYLEELDPAIGTKYPFLFTPKNITEPESGKSYFLLEGKIPSEIRHHRLNTWCFFGWGQEGIISYFCNANDEVVLNYYFRDFNDKQWNQKKLFTTKAPYQKIVKLVRLSNDIVCLALDEQWYRITWDMVKACL
jgi:hypothetical protein